MVICLGFLDAVTVSVRGGIVVTVAGRVGSPRPEADGFVGGTVAPGDRPPPVVPQPTSVPAITSPVSSGPHAGAVKRCLPMTPWTLPVRTALHGNRDGRTRGRRPHRDRRAAPGLVDLGSGGQGRQLLRDRRFAVRGLVLVDDALAHGLV